MNRISALALLVAALAGSLYAGLGDSYRPADWEVYGPQVGGRFGTSTAPAGDLNGDGWGDVVIGAPMYDGAATNSGAAFVYFGSATGLSTTHGWKVEGTASNDNLGICVRGLGDVNGDGFDDLGVGAPLLDLGLTDEGAVLVFYGGLGWPHGDPDDTPADADWRVETDILYTTGFGNTFESRLDVNGDSFPDLLVGAPFFKSGGIPKGGLFLFLGSANGFNGGLNATLANAVWSFIGPNAGDQMGRALSRIGRLNDDVYDDFLVGSPVANGSNRGTVYAFEGRPTGQSPVQTFSLIGSDFQELGYSIAGGTDLNRDGFDDFVVGVPRWGGYNKNGLVYIFYGSASGVGGQSYIPSLQSDRFGHSVACPGDVTADGFADVVVGAPIWRSGPTTVKGLVTVFEGGADGLSTHGGWVNTQGSWSGNYAFGEVVAGAGDVNGDETQDLLVASAWENSVGKVWCFHSTGPSFEHKGCHELPPDQVISPADDPGFGLALARGDVDHDGYEDVAVSDHLQVRVHLGGPNGLNTNRALLLRAPFYLPLGASVAFADTNGDGFDDVVIGFGGRTSVLPWAYNPGFVRVYFGSATGFNPSYWEARSSLVDHFGESVTSLGDLDGDGDEEIAVGGHGHRNVLYNDPFPTVPGKVYVWRGSPQGPNDGFSGTESNAYWTAASDLGGASEDLFGTSIAGVGDLDDDGAPDLAIGAPGREVNAELFAGTAYVWNGSFILSGVPGSPANATWKIEGTDELEELGIKVARAGDVKVDGYADMAVGSLWRGPNEAFGRVHVYYGTPTGPDVANPWNAASQSRAGNGLAIAGAGDFNSDGDDDLLIGSPYLSNQEFEEGRVELFLGGSQGLCTTPHLYVHGGYPSTWLGRAVTLADVDGDGFSDLVAGAPYLGTGELRVWSGTDRLWMEASPTQVAAGDSLTLKVLGGNPGSPLAMFVGSINGLPTSRLILVSAVDDDSCFEITATVPPGLSGLVLTLFTATLDCRGKPVLSNEVTITLL